MASSSGWVRRGGDSGASFFFSLDPPIFIYDPSISKSSLSIIRNSFQLEEELQFLLKDLFKKMGINASDSTHGNVDTATTNNSVGGNMNNGETVHNSGKSRNF